MFVLQQSNLHRGTVRTVPLVSLVYLFFFKKFRIEVGFLKLNLLNLWMEVTEDSDGCCSAEAHSADVRATTVR